VTKLRQAHVRMRIVRWKVQHFPRAFFTKSATTLLREINEVIDEYGCDMTVAEILGVLDLAKDDVLRVANDYDNSDYFPDCS
jgi:hypothetical protein